MSVAKRLLIVEDTATIQSLIKVYLMGFRLEVLEARDGNEGLQLAREMRPELILSDVQMPGMDGFQLCAAIRSDPQLAQTPFVLLSSLKDEASRRMGKMVGATNFLSKPISVDALRLLVSQLMDLPATTAR